MNPLTHFLALILAFALVQAQVDSAESLTTAPALGPESPTVPSFNTVMNPSDVMTSVVADSNAATSTAFDFASSSTEMATATKPLGTKNAQAVPSATTAVPSASAPAPVSSQGAVPGAAGGPAAPAQVHGGTGIMTQTPQRPTFLPSLTSSVGTFSTTKAKSGAIGLREVGGVNVGMGMAVVGMLHMIGAVAMVVL